LCGGWGLLGRDRKAGWSMRMGQWGNGAMVRTIGRWEDKTMRPWGDWEMAIGAV
jgi:hypothetical protein